MEPKQYFEGVLKGQELKDDSQELKNLQKRRQEVEGILHKGFPKANPTIRYGGSKAKDTLIRESYDLDIVFYLPHDETSAGESLKDIFQNVVDVLSLRYYVDPKRSAVRLRDKENKIDFHIDVVPGRYVDDSKSDCFIYQNGADKGRLKTNLDVHIRHVKESGLIPAIKLLKLWKTRRGLQIKQFIFELLIIKLLAEKKTSALDTQLKHVWTSIKEADGPISVEDLANPEGNDLSDFIKSAWSELSARSTDTLNLLEQSGWEAIFGIVDEDSRKGNETERLRSAAAVVTTATNPWLGA